MFGLLHNLYKYCKTRSERRITIILLGLDNAGKSTLSHTLQGELDKETSPTFGFNNSTVVQGKYKVDIFDLGGGKNIRSVWKKYLSEVHAVVFVVDAADPTRFEEAKGALMDTLGSDFLKGKPLLVLANKQDLPTAATAAEVAQSLGLMELSQNRHNILPCTAKTPAGQSADTRVAEGLKWVISAVDSDYVRLNPRVQAEAGAVRAEEAAKKKEREERMRKARDERLRRQKEEEDAAAQGQQVPEAQPAEHIAARQQSEPLHSGLSSTGHSASTSTLVSVQDNALHNGKALSTASHAAISSGAAVPPLSAISHLPSLGLPNQIESPGKPPQGFAKREFSELRPNSTEQPTSSHTPLVPGLQTLLEPAIPAPLQPLPPSRPTSAHLSASASGNSQQQQQHHQQQPEVLNDSLPARPPSCQRGPSPTSGPTPATDANEPLQHTVTGGNGGGGGLHGGSSHRGSMPLVHSNRVVPLEGHVAGQASEGAS